ncbi:uncharacterized protein DDB_G0286591-like [Chelonus insularis]|uniref:uncharacterized protein DDB_G0286591-like n=1 Tax=Chelonus insularis TaxID=460826 RepID=UPI00158BF707|nr:uncharacterized protein DDB_G0286591-like [Chelonus insularis]XP_034952606.1 uncharacterized protein DDB_G0286591-like [Chelonus insularis]
MEAEATTENPRPPWYTEIFKYFKSHNRIDPGKIELPDCDFLIIKPGRTLRILKPTPMQSGFYELNSDRPESINENFITRWTKRPHSVNNCRCSFRQSSKLEMTEEWISTKINQIKQNLSEVEVNNDNVNEIDKKLSVTTESSREMNDSFVNINLLSNNQIVKSNIVKDLETYIDKLLNEILSDTMKFMNDSDNTLRKSYQALNKINQQINPMKENECDTQLSKSSLDISFIFHGNDHDQINYKNDYKNEGYTNQVFVGSDDDPDCLNFYLKQPVGSSRKHDIMDCVDSGINSVETIEFPIESDLNLEESLMQIIDEKFGYSSPLKELTNQNTQETFIDSIQDNEDKNKVNSSKVALHNYNICNFSATDENKVINFKNQSNDEKFNLTENVNTTPDINKPDQILKPVTFLCEELSVNVDNNSHHDNNNKITRKEKNLNNDNQLEEKKIEIEDYKVTWKDYTESSQNDNESLTNSVICRRHKKPIIVFFHGFGSSSEAFKHQLEYFTQMGYPCIAPDMLGHGMSSTPNKSRDYHFDKLLNDLEVVLKHYAFQSGQKCVLVAHNYGCSFATALACKYSNEIHQLVLISGGGPTPLAPPSKEGTGHCCLRIVLSPLLMCGLHRELLYSVKGRQHPYCGLESQGQWPSHMQYVLDGMVWPEGDYIFHRRICTPTLLIHGLRDKKVSLVQECQMERTIVKAFLEAIPTAGHAPMIDTPEQVNHMIHCFIDLWKRKNR